MRDARRARRDAGSTVELAELGKVYSTGAGGVVALDGISLELPAGTFTAVMGPSGSGKTTLLYCTAGLDTPTSGRVRVGGVELPRSEAALARFRRDRIGMVFQQFNLLPALTAQQNVVLPLQLAGRRIDPRAAGAVLDRLGLAGLAGRRPAELSGGQQQRVAIARALLGDAHLILADEPTGALDSAAARDVLALLREAVTVHGRAVVMVTHDPAAAAHADRIHFLADGRLAGQLDAPSADAAAERLAHLGEPALGAGAAQVR